MPRVIAVGLLAALHLSIALGADAHTPPPLSPAEQAQLLAEAKSRLDSWAGESKPLEEARERASKVVAADSMNVDAHVLLARYYMSSGYQSYGRYDNGALERAGKELAIAHRIDPKSPSMLLSFARLNNLRFRPNLASTYLDQAEAAHANQVVIDILRADACVIDGKWDKAQAIIDKIEKDEPSLGAATLFERVHVFETKGQILIHFHQIDKAIDTFRSITILAPDYAWGHGNYAEVVLLWKADAKTAIAEAQKAIALMSYGVARFTLGTAQYVKWATLRHSSAEARATFELARTNAPDVTMVMARTAGHVAAGRPLEKLVEALSKNGVSLNSRDASNDGCTPLTRAILDDDTKSVDWLIAHKANVNTQGIHDRTPIFLAVERNNVPLVTRLIKLKANVNIADANGETPLLAAAGEGYGPMAKMLLDAGADSTVQISGQDAASMATFNKHPEVAQIIRDYKSTASK